jgi:putative phage-type endonuclease
MGDPILLEVPYTPEPESEGRKKFLADRKSGIGGSDIAAILGLSQWKSPLEVYLDKVGEEVADRDNEPMFWGRTHEAAVADEAARRLGCRFQRVNLTYRQDYRLANIDRRVINTSIGDQLRSLLPENIAGKTDLKVGVEIKTASTWMQGEWMSEGVPPVYGCQCQWYLDITGWDTWILAVLFGGNQLKLWLVTPDLDAIAVMRAVAAEFWSRVERKDPPAPGPSAPDGLLLKKMYPREAGGKEVEWLPEVDRLRAMYLEASAAIAKWEESRDGAQHLLQHLMKDGEVINCPDGSRITWKSNRDRVVEEVDIARFKEEQPLIAERYITTKTIPGPRVLRVAKPKKPTTKE